MAKKEAVTLEVHLQNDWFSGASLYRKVNNPHMLPESVLDKLPSSASVMENGKLVPVDDIRSAPEEEKVDVAKAPAKSDIKL